MWLNEAFTVDVDRQFMASQFDPACTRLDEVEHMRAPIGGPLSIEDAGHMGNIVRQGFNDPDELVDGVTYVKAAEVIRMLRLLIGAGTFRRGKNLYFRRHAGGNANTDQFFSCFEEASGRDLKAFKKEWLYTIGYPRVRVSHAYDPGKRRLHLTFRQTRAGKGGPFHVPLALAAVDANGRDIPKTVKAIEISGSKTAVTLSGVRRPAFLSLNRDCSFYGTLTDVSSSPGQLAQQIRLDPNGFNRVEAMRRLTDLERIRHIRNARAPVRESWLSVYGDVLRDKPLPPGLKAYLLRIDEAALDRKYLPCYRERYAARERLLGAAAGRFMEDLLDVFRSTDTYAPAVEPRDGLEKRLLKAVLLRTVTAADTPATQQLAEDHFHRAWNISDKVSALRCVHISRHPRRRDLLEEGYALWKDHVGAYSAYLQIIGAGMSDDVFEMIEAEEKRPTFRLHHPGHSRALFLPLTGNNKLLWTERGIDWVAQTAIRMAPVNENTANRLIACFQLVHKLADDLQPRVLAALKTVRRGVDASKAPSVAGRVNAYLRGT